MTAYVSRQYHDRVEVLVDGGLYDDDGVLVGKANKLRVAPNLPLVLTGRGKSAVIDRLASSILQIAAKHLTVDNALGEVAAWVNWMREKRTSEGTINDQAPGDLLIAGISESTGAGHWSFDARGNEHRPQLQLLPVGQSVIAGGRLSNAEHEAFLTESAGGLSSIGRKTFDLMRRNKAEVADHVDIGAHLDLAIVRGSKVRTVRLHSWNDKIGSLIQP